MAALSVTVQGRLAADAECRIDGRTGQSSVTVVLGQGDAAAAPAASSARPRVLCATLLLGDDAEAQQHARALAATLRRGRAVRVVGEGLAERFIPSSRFLTTRELAYCLRVVRGVELVAGLGVAAEVQWAAA